MRRATFVAALGAVFLVAGSVAYAADTDAASNAKSDSSEIVCKSLPPATGTRLGGRRICKTQGEWDRDRQQAQDTLSRTQINRGVSGGN